MARLNDFIDDYLPIDPGQPVDEEEPADESEEEGGEIYATEPGVTDPSWLEGWPASPVDAEWLVSHEMKALVVTVVDGGARFSVPEPRDAGVAIMSGPPENGENDLSETYATAPGVTDPGEAAPGEKSVGALFAEQFNDTRKAGLSIAPQNQNGTAFATSDERLDLEIEEKATPGGAVWAGDVGVIDFVCEGPRSYGVKKDDLHDASIERKSPIYGESGEGPQALEAGDAGTNHGPPVAEPPLQDWFDAETMNNDLLDAYVLVIDDAVEIA